MHRPFYLTTTLPYVNADPHIGFALEMVQADVTARYRALQGDDVFFTTGTDEHGQKIFDAAQKAGKDPQGYVDEFAAKFRSLKEKLDLKDDLHFIRTTDPHHVAAAQEIWRRCAAKGDIEKRTYKGLYCVGDEAFMKESELVNGRCPNHPNMDLIELEEENYFFLLSTYQQPILEYLSREGVIVPEWRRQEAIKFVEKGLEDFSISRVKEKMSWGIPVPGDDTQVMYVWFDALTNYISTLGWPDDAEGNFKKFWNEGEVVQMAGKDQVRFQSIMWQAMLMSAGIKNTDRVVYHGFITSGGQKMSKSLGNVIDPMAIVSEYGADALRYFLARHIQPFEDTDVTLDKFKEVYNADLANGLGNLASRVLKMLETYKKNSVNFHFEPRDKVALLTMDSPYSRAMNEYRFNDALSFVWSLIQNADRAITEIKPFLIAKENPQEAYRISSVLSGVTTKESIAPLISQREAEESMRMTGDLHTIAILLEPFLPATSQQLQNAIAEQSSTGPRFPRKE